MKKLLDEAVKEAIVQHKITNHDEFISILAKQYQLHINQSTLSRKLKKHNITKQDGYYQKVKSFTFNVEILDIKLSPPNMIVIHTSPGHANAVAFPLDSIIRSPGHNSRLDQYILGTVAGDDTIVVITDGRTSLLFIRKLIEKFINAS